LPLPRSHIVDNSYIAGWLTKWSSPLQKLQLKTCRRELYSLHEKQSIFHQYCMQKSVWIVKYANICILKLFFNHCWSIWIIFDWKVLQSGSFPNRPIQRKTLQSSKICEHLILFSLNFFSFILFFVVHFFFILSCCRNCKNWQQLLLVVLSHLTKKWM
jgi:hypothetical protein